MSILLSCINMRSTRQLFCQVSIMFAHSYFTTIKYYTTLKRAYGHVTVGKGFTTIKNYTTLKPILPAGRGAGFTTIKNYTQLSNYYCGVPREIEVLLPLRITQRSNINALLAGVHGICWRYFKLVSRLPYKAVMIP